MPAILPAITYAHYAGREIVLPTRRKAGRASLAASLRGPLTTSKHEVVRRYSRSRCTWEVPAQCFAGEHTLRKRHVERISTPANRQLRHRDHPGSTPEETSGGTHIPPSPKRANLAGAGRAKELHFWVAPSRVRLTTTTSGSHGSSCSPTARGANLRHALWRFGTCPTWPTGNGKGSTSGDAPCSLRYGPVQPRPVTTVCVRGSRTGITCAKRYIVARYTISSDGLIREATYLRYLLMVPSGVDTARQQPNLHALSTALLCGALRLKL